MNRLSLPIGLAAFGLLAFTEIRNIEAPILCAMCCACRVLHVNTVLVPWGVGFKINAGRIKCDYRAHGENPLIACTLVVA